MPVTVSLAVFLLLAFLISPALSQDSHRQNGLIALTLRDAAGHLQVFTIEPDGTHRKQLTFTGDSGRPAWSADGRKIAFMSIRDDRMGVWTMNGDGSDKKMLTEGLSPDWSHDGGKLAFARPDNTGKCQIWTINSDGTGQRQVTHSPTFKVGPSWSPDDTKFVFILIRNPGSRTDPQPQIGIMNADGSDERILTTQKRVNVRVNADGSKTTLETANDANAPAWSPVDHRVAFWSGIENHYGQVWTINSDGTASRQLTAESSPINSDDPSWSPDGKLILYSTNRSRTRNELWVMNADGTDQHKVSDIDAVPFPGRASWQPIIAK